MTIKICIYIEKFLFPELYFEFILNFLKDIDSNFDLYTYIPDIDIVIIKKKYTDIANYLKKNNIKVKNKIFNNFKTNILIIFSEYDRKMYFDRRELIIESIKFNDLVMINTNNLNNVDIIQNKFLEKLFYNSFNSIFETYKYSTADKLLSFKQKYKLDNKGIISIILSDDNNDFKIPQNVFDKYNIISINKFKQRNIIAIKQIDFIYLISFSISFITDSKYYDFIKNTTNNPTQLLDNINFENINFDNIHKDLKPNIIDFIIKNILYNKFII